MAIGIFAYGEYYSKLSVDNIGYWPEVRSQLQ
jgi:hypothetical protein